MSLLTLRKRRLGHTDMDLTAVGFGAWALGGGGWAYAWGSQDDAESVRAIRHAVDSGVNWIDTSNIYGYGHSEEVVGQALREIPERDRPFVFTKVGMRPVPSDPYAEPVRDLHPDQIRAGAEASLRRLGIERIDLFQFHWPDATGVPVEDSWGEMARLVDEGKVRAPGVSNFDTALLERCEAVRHVDSLQPPFSPVDRAAGDELLPWCARHGTGVIVYSPMQSGLLTGAFSAERVANLPDDDWRKRDAEFQEPNLTRNLELVDTLESVAGRRGVPTPVVAISWTLRWPGVTGAIVGARSPRQVDGWIAAGATELPDGDMEEIAEAIRSSGAGRGPALPATRS